MYLFDDLSPLCGPAGGGTATFKEKPPQRCHNFSQEFNQEKLRVE